MSDMAIEYARRPISVDDYYRMGEAGIFDPDERIELLDGELIVVPPMSSPHADSIEALTRLLVPAFDGRARVRPQLPVTIRPLSEPLPDLALVAIDRARTCHPAGPDVLLAIEVAVSSRDFDLHKKGPIYARAGMLEYWVLDVSTRRLFVHREPDAGGYAFTRILRAGERIAPVAFPDDELAIEAMF